LIIQNEFDRRWREMSKTSSWGLGDMPERNELILNSNHKFCRKILDEGNNDNRQVLARQAYDIARLTRNELKGQELTDFINRSINMISG
jgi:molecular chaperone HtpG